MIWYSPELDQILLQRFMSFSYENDFENEKIVYDFATYGVPLDGDNIGSYAWYYVGFL